MLIIIVELIWSGHKKGPPRKLKFPEDGVVADEARNFLKTDKN